MAKLYIGIPRAGALGNVYVLAGGRRRRLRKCRLLHDHSSEFAWGYAGSGPAQLALAILMDATGNVPLALSQYQLFKAEVIARFPQEVRFEFDADAVHSWLHSLDKAEVDADTHYMHCALWALRKIGAPPHGHPSPADTLFEDGPPLPI